MKFTKIACTLGLALATLPALAQYEGTDPYERIRRTVAAEDTTDAQGNVYSFQTDISSKNYKEAYKGWKWLLEKAPLSITGIYKYGPHMLYSLITDASATAEEKKQYLDDLLHMYDVRLQNLAALNSFDKYPASEGDVLTYKAYWYYRCGNGVDPEYNYNKIYAFYKEGITSVATMGGHDVSPAILYEFFTTSKALYDSGQEYYYDQFLLDYVTIINACDKMMQNAKEGENAEEQLKMVKDYDNIMQNVNYQFKNSPAANPESLINHYTKTVEEKQGDYEYLQGAIMVMYSNNLMDNEAFYNASQYAYDIEPSYESALGCARKEMALGNTEAANQYYEKALELTDDVNQKAKICATVASSLGNNGQTTEALAYADRIEQYDSTCAGIAAWTRGEIYALSMKWDQSITFFREAGEKDVTLAEEANRMIAKIEKYKSDQAAVQAEIARRAAAQKAAQQAAAKQAEAKKAAAAAGPRQLTPAQLAAKAEYDKKMAEYKKKKAEYDKQKAAFDARKKADDAFWGGGK